MSIFEEIKEGDRVVIQTGRDWWGNARQLLKIETVTKVTKTQITAGGIRFLRRNGYEVGVGIRSAARILDNGIWGQDARLMTPTEAETENVEIKREIDHKKLARRMQDTKFHKLSYDALLRLAKVLDEIESAEVKEDSNENS